MSPFQTLDISVDSRGVATLMLNRPEKHNALSAQMLLDLMQAAYQLGSEDAVRVVVLTGAGNSFCAGGDLAWMQEQMSMDAATRKAEARKLASALSALDRMPKPLIGKLHGNAFGGAVGLACICDVAFGAQHIKMGLTETRLGLIPATIGPYVVARMGVGAARQVFMSGRIFAAHEAVRLGVLADTASADSLDALIEREVDAYLTCAPGAVANAKALARALGPRVEEVAIENSIEALAAQWESAEAVEGIASFFAKRRPWWAT